MPKGLIRRVGKKAVGMAFRPKKEKAPEKTLEQRKKDLKGHQEKLIKGLEKIAEKAEVGPATQKEVWEDKWDEQIEKKGEYTMGLTVEESVKEISAKADEDAKEVDRAVRVAKFEMDTEIQNASKVILTSAPEYFRESDAYLQQVIGEMKAGGDRGEYEAAVKDLMKINTELLLQIGDASAPMWGYGTSIGREGTKFVKRNMNKMADQLREQSVALESALQQKPGVFRRFRNAAVAKNPFSALVKKPKPKGKPTRA